MSDDAGPPIRFDGVLYWYLEYSDPAEDRCSLCRELIPEDDIPLILWRGKGKQTIMARLHYEPCGTKLMGTGYIKITRRG